MPEPPRRKRVQLHLSTAIVLMFVAGALIWANVREREHWFHFRNQMPIRDVFHGWPYVVVLDTEINYLMATSNVLIAVGLLAAFWFLCEWLIRCRAARKGMWNIHEPTRRKRFQIHLSTAIVLMFVAGVFIWANVTTSDRFLELSEDKVEETWEINRKRFLSTTNWYVYKYHVQETGWPTAWSYRILEEGGYFAIAPTREHEKSGLRARNIVINASVGFAILLAVWLLCEWRIRLTTPPKNPP